MDCSNSDDSEEESSEHSESAVHQEEIKPSRKRSRGTCVFYSIDCSVGYMYYMYQFVYTLGSKRRFAQFTDCVLHSMDSQFV